jgi:hypothetical protein
VAGVQKAVQGNLVNACPYTGVRQHVGSHSHIRGFPGKWGCIPMSWVNPGFPRCWGTPAVENAFSHAGVSQYMGMHFPYTGVPQFVGMHSSIWEQILSHICECMLANSFWNPQLTTVEARQIQHVADVDAHMPGVTSALLAMGWSQWSLDFPMPRVFFDDIGNSLAVGNSYWHSEYPTALAVPNRIGYSQGHWASQCHLESREFPLGRTLPSGESPLLSVHLQVGSPYSGMYTLQRARAPIIGSVHSQSGLSHWGEHTSQ